MQIDEHAPIAPFTSFYIGSSVRYLLTVTNASECQQALLFAQEKKKRVIPLGYGTNTIFSDDPIDACVIRFQPGKVSFDGQFICVDAGVSLSDVVTYAISHGLSGLEKLSGIPGSLGGAIVGNAGAFGRSISDVVDTVTVMYEGAIQTWSKELCEYGYRESRFKHESIFVLYATLRCEPGKKDVLQSESDRIISIRNKKYPQGIKTAGSFFKNILYSSLSAEQAARIDQSKVIEGKVPTGYLLDEVGARGLREGDIVVSRAHGNLIENVGKGTAKQVQTLSSLLKEKVKNHFDITLEEEVRFI